MTLWRDCPECDGVGSRPEPEPADYQIVCSDCCGKGVVPLVIDREQIHDALAQAMFPTGTGDSYDGADAVIALLTGEGHADD